MIQRLLLITCVSVFGRIGMVNAEESPMEPGRARACFTPPGVCEAMPGSPRSVPFPSLDRPESPYGFILAQADASAVRDSTPQAETRSEPDTFWASVWDYLYNGASITVGVGTRESDLAVTRKSDGAYGKIAQRNDQAYFLSYSTRESFIGTSNVGYTVMLNYSTFYMDKQVVDKQYVDLGTQVKGRVVYLVPTLFYQWGAHREDGRFVRAGVGVGVGAAKYSGSIILDYPTNKTPVTVSSDKYDLRVTPGVFLEARYRYWGLKVSFAGPNYEDKTYRYSVSDIAINLGYSFYF